MKEHTYKQIPGNFNYKHIYKAMVQRFPTGSTFLEIGSFGGKSGCYMATEIYNSGKDIKWYMVDNWAYNYYLRGRYTTVDGVRKQVMLTAAEAKSSAVNAVKEFKNFTTIYAKSSEAACDEFRDKTLDFVWVDGDHSYTQCKLDIDLWLPKMKPNGIIAGHDYHSSNVSKAVSDVFGDTSYINYEYLINLIDLPKRVTQSVYEKGLTKHGPHAVCYGSAWLIDLELHKF